MHLIGQLLAGEKTGYQLRVKDLEGSDRDCLKHYSNINLKVSSFLPELRVVGEFFLPTKLAHLKHLHNQRTAFCGLRCLIHNWCSQTEHSVLFWNSGQMIAQKNENSPVINPIFRKEKGGCHSQGSSFVRWTLKNERTIEVQRYSRTNYLYIQGFSSSCEVSLELYYTNLYGVRVKPPEILVFPLCPRSISLESFCAYPIWTKAVLVTSVTLCCPTQM